MPRRLGGASQDTIAGTRSQLSEVNRWPLIVSRRHPNYVDDGYHRNAFLHAGTAATDIPTIPDARTLPRRGPRPGSHAGEREICRPSKNRTRPRTAGTRTTGRRLLLRAPSRVPRPGLRSTAESLRYRGRTCFRSEITPNPATGRRRRHPGGGGQPRLTGYVGKCESGRLALLPVRRRACHRRAHAAHVPWLPEVRGLGSAMMDDLYAHARGRTPSSTTAPHPARGITGGRGYQEPHHGTEHPPPPPDAGWHHYWSRPRSRSDIQPDRAGGAPTPPVRPGAVKSPSSRDEAWTQARGTKPGPAGEPPRSCRGRTRAS